MTEADKKNYKRPKYERAMTASVTSTEKKKTRSLRKIADGAESTIKDLRPRYKSVEEELKALKEGNDDLLGQI